MGRRQEESPGRAHAPRAGGRRKMLRLTDSSGPGLIPMDARLRPDRRGHLEMVGTDRSSSGHPVHPLTFSIGPEAELQLKEDPHQGDWIFVGYEAGELLIEPAGPDEGTERAEPIFWI